MGDLDTTFAALSHADRRDMLRRLGAGELRISELAEPYPVTLNAVSKHIKVLESAGLVTRRRHGREHFIALNPDPLREVAEVVSSFRLPNAS